MVQVRDASLEDLLPSLEGLLSLKGEAPAPRDSSHLCWLRSLQEAASQAQAALQAQTAGDVKGEASAKLRQEALDSAAVVEGFSATVRPKAPHHLPIKG